MTDAEQRETIQCHEMLKPLETETAGARLTVPTGIVFRLTVSQDELRYLEAAARYIDRHVLTAGGDSKPCSRWDLLYDGERPMAIEDRAALLRKVILAEPVRVYKIDEMWDTPDAKGEDRGPANATT